MGKIATAEIYDANSDQFLAQTDVPTYKLTVNNDWSRISQPITVTNPNNRLEFRVYWQGTANLDVAALRIR